MPGWRGQCAHECHVGVKLEEVVLLFAIIPGPRQAVQCFALLLASHSLLGRANKLRHSHCQQPLLFFSLLTPGRLTMQNCSSSKVGLSCRAACPSRQCISTKAERPRHVLDLASAPYVNDKKPFPLTSDSPSGVTVTGASAALSGNIERCATEPILGQSRFSCRWLRIAFLFLNQTASGLTHTTRVKSSQPLLHSIAFQSRLVHDHLESRNCSLATRASDPESMSMPPDFSCLPCH